MRPRACNGGSGHGAPALLLIACVTAALTACSSGGSVAHGVPSPPSSSPPSQSSTTPVPTADLLSGCAPPLAFSSLPVIAHVPGADDLAAAPDGSLWVDDAQRTLVHVSSSGSVLQRIDDPRAPEGIVALPDGSLLLAEQAPDRIVRLQPATMSLSVVLQLTPRTGQEGVDGIAYDPASNMLLIPDAPNGTLLELALDGGAPTRLASGLGRPVGAATSGDGGLVVAAEDSTGLFHVAAGGAVTRVDGVTQADDVIVSGGLAYVTSLSTRQLIAVDIAAGRSRVLVTGDQDPQGLTRLPDGRLALSDSSAGAVVSLRGCSGSADAG